MSLAVIVLAASVARWRAQRDGCPSPGQFIPFGVNHHRARQISAAQMRQDEPIRIHRGDL